MVNKTKLKSNKVSRRLDKSTCLELFRKMFLIRQFEMASGEHYTLGNIRGFLHLYIGQEATAVGAVSILHEEDYIVSNYRDHGHALARGLDSNRVMAELFGKKQGISKGKGGSMHIFDVNHRFMGGHAIVGAQLPLAAGLALALKHQNKPNVAVCFLGDGSTAQGVYHETLNLASLWNLPVVFILENNGFGMGTSINRARAIGDDLLGGITESYNIKSYSVDGMDVLAVKDLMQSVTDEMRYAPAPVFIQADNYRYEGHSLADGQNYRDEKDIKPWRAKDPILTFPRLMIDDKIATKNEIEQIKADVDAEVAEAVDFALKGSVPDLEELWEDIYAE